MAMEMYLLKPHKPAHIHENVKREGPELVNFVFLLEL